MVDAGSPPHPGQLNAVIKAALDLLECDNIESAKALLRAFSGGSATNWPKDGQDMARRRYSVQRKPQRISSRRGSSCHLRASS